MGIRDLKGVTDKVVLEVQSLSSPPLRFVSFLKSITHLTIPKRNRVLLRKTSGRPKL
jgi:hypothetical protein